MLTVQALQNTRNDGDFNRFFETVLEKANLKRTYSFVKSPVLPRKRKPNPRYDYGETAAEFPASAKNDYYEALDLLTSSIKTRFSQPSLQTYQNLETLLLIGLQDIEVKEQLQLLHYHFEGNIDCL